ncbi:diguanylate cyclase [Paraburkholderia caballeronis]|uniref:diguanylate cyclase n=1 Tax=Paraburkholderia caballeronis TaxID=416943 RepID=UPI001065755F|nr:diguanylate cyclase [Paraburkholderia caballeronis]TDV19718.1 response regulator receiver modulated diguanylate cyclase [Paraburkholderia caballeronis]TDV22317.1 response regulator receiver modulated diguanylate cyclase [Paraburkholderia caballeronis]TDV29221.1 response regulator receiver modulated diguanylate cyclase [Paraburkholderia caballeronis]
MHALIIEDSPVFVRIIEHVLHALGFETTFVGTAADGNAALDQQVFDLLILDLHLPDQDGLEFCRQLRARASHRLLPVLMLTSDESEPLLRRALEAGVTELFHKARLADVQVSLRDYITRLQRQYKGRVLLVEDSPTTAALLRYMLTRMSLTVDHVDTAEAALAALPDGNYDLIVSDVVLAGKITGLGLVRAVRAMESEVSRTPILGLSASEDTARKIEMLKLGANDYVSKPVIEEEFVARVGNLVTAKQLFDQVLEQRRELRERSIRDPLTGLYNRRYLAEMSAQLFAQAEREHQPISLIVLDLDHFKAVNDTHGHDTGDVVLSGIGKLLAQSCRQGDVLARFGGEEFVAVLPNCAEETARQCADRLLDAVRTLRPAGLDITASIGVASANDAAAYPFDALFKIADQAVYAAKHGGRNQVVMGNPMLQAD